MVWMVQPRINETLLDADHNAAKNNVLDRINDIVQVMLKASFYVAGLHLGVQFQFLEI